MSFFVQNLDATSPLIIYSGPWAVGGADGDPETSKYDKRTFKFCSGVGCSASIGFTGTEVHVVGASRLNSGPFQVTVDGNQSAALGTTPTTSEAFKLDLFNQTLATGTHALTIFNLPPWPDNPGDSYLNLEYIWWKTDTDSPTDVRLQDDTPAFSYQPVTAWNSDLTNLNLPGFDAGTGHATSQSGATAIFAFVGDRVALYGAIGSQGGLYTVQVDNGSVSTFNTNIDVTFELSAGQMIFYANSLPPGNHTVTVTAKPVSVTQGLTIDYAIVDGTQNSVTSPTPTPHSGTTLSSAVRSGIIAAAVVVGISALALVVYTLYGRPRHRAKLPEEIDMLEESTNGIHPFHDSPMRGEETSPPRYEPSASPGIETPTDRIYAPPRSKRAKQLPYFPLRVVNHT
ncbi:hypothetical protein B0H17DRAFT_1203507 [Mycena rosella]|uniref:Transmembrane protein n=1 Tax=Mycena rosella TaxID=1033263 RepID=A0AAD7GC49_MYCRO|nr:hypothetical protein B0H17DRAFT_1203507 [Mycena rosella]